MWSAIQCHIIELRACHLDCRRDQHISVGDSIALDHFKLLRQLIVYLIIQSPNTTNPAMDVHNHAHVTLPSTLIPLTTDNSSAD